MRPSEVKLALDVAFDSRLPVMMWGSPGIGKSDIVRQVAAARSRKVRDIRLALLDPTDLRGIPFYNPEKNTAEWAVASILPQDPDSTDVIFLDEINAAPPVIQAAAYQLVLDRRIGDYELPEKVDIVAAGNREGDKAVTFKMPTPLLNRFIHIDFKVHFDDWYDWAVQNKVHDHVVGYLNHQKGKLEQFDAKSKSRGFPTPRSWCFVSRLLETGGASDSIMRGLIGGAIGEGAAIEFSTYRKVYLTLPNPDDVLTGKVKEMPQNSELSAHYAMITGLSYALQAQHEKLVVEKGLKKPTKEWLQMAALYFDFIHASFKPEFCVLGVRDCLKNMKLPMIQAPNWKSFAKDYTKMVMAA